MPARQDLGETTFSLGCKPVGNFVLRARGVESMAQFLTTTSASPEPTLPAASVARTISRWTPGLSSGKATLICSRSVSKRPSSGKSGVQAPPSRAYSALTSAGQVVGQHDQGLLFPRRHRDLGRFMIDDE